MVKAEALENQLVTWLHAFQPDAQLRQLVLDTIRAGTQAHPGEDQNRRRELLSQLDRLQDLYVLGDLSKPRYVMRRQALRGRATTPRSTRRPAARLRPGDPRRLPPLLARRARPCRATQAHQQPLRPRLARQRRDRRRQTPTRVRTLLQSPRRHPAQTPKNKPEKRGAESGNDEGRARDCHPADRDPAVRCESAR
jgi:hypothetical protein